MMETIEEVNKINSPVLLGDALVLLINVNRCGKRMGNGEMMDTYE